MPRYDTVCHDCEACWDDVFVSLSKREELGGIPCPECGKACPVSWHNKRAPGVLATSSSITVPGLKGEFSSYREVEKAADKLGKRIMEGDEKEAVRESNREASAAYARELGYGSKEEYGEARRKEGTTMVHQAREKYVEQQRQRYGAGYNLSTTDKKWGSAGLRQTKS